MDQSNPLTLVSLPDHAAPSRRGRNPETLIQSLFAQAGVGIQGAQPWDIRVNDERFYVRVLAQGSLGLGESYMEGWWDCERIDEMIYRVLHQRVDRSCAKSWQWIFSTLRAKLINQQTLGGSTRVADVHYDLGNTFFERLLGPSMVYSCGYWRDAQNLDQAQEQKLELICQKLQLKPGERLLDIGCGWGALARYAAERYGCSVTGITISKQQYEYACRWVSNLPVQIMLADYRSSQVRALPRFDKIASVGMFEHVGAKNYRAFMRIVHDLLEPRGLFLLHTIGQHGATEIDPWVNRYIFPNSRLPTSWELATATRGSLVLEDWQNFGSDYDLTLRAWLANLERHATSPDFGQDQRFLRMWRYFLSIFAGCFRVRDRCQLWQLVLAKGGVAGRYDAPRSVRSVT